MAWEWILKNFHLLGFTAFAVAGAAPSFIRDGYLYLIYSVFCFYEGTLYSNEICSIRVPRWRELKKVSADARYGFSDFS